MHAEICMQNRDKKKIQKEEKPRPFLLSTMSNNELG